MAAALSDEPQQTVVKLANKYKREFGDIKHRSFKAIFTKIANSPDPVRAVNAVHDVLNQDPLFIEWLETGGF